MKRKGASMFISIVIGVMIFIMGLTILNFVKPEISNARVALDCNNLNITDGNKVTCLGTDIVLPYLILTVLSVAGGFLFRFVA